MDKITRRKQVEDEICKNGSFGLREGRFMASREEPDYISEAVWRLWLDYGEELVAVVDKCVSLFNRGDWGTACQYPEDLLLNKEDGKAFGYYETEFGEIDVVREVRASTRDGEKISRITVFLPFER